MRYVVDSRISNVIVIDNESYEVGGGMFLDRFHNNNVMGLKVISNASYFSGGGVYIWCWIVFLSDL
ncbi:MAG: hypothetical protein N2712_07215 [Brevinematales bacterium]|nr:hypothetical protein [Brevinematales bacterium]